MRCEEVRSNISALLDDELERHERAAVESHLASCAACRSYAERIARVRQAVRLQAVEEVPDLTDRIERAITVSPIRPSRRAYARTAAIAAAAALLVFLGTSIDVFDRTRDVATADEIVGRVQSAARSLNSYRATFEIVEHGWHPEVPLRRLEANVWFSSPERFRLEVTDKTAYPDENWPRNDVELVASPRRWSISEPSTCPAASLPACASIAPREVRTIVDRQPFDGNSALPTDIAIPLETLSSAEALEVIESTGGMHRVALTYEQAAPLVRALQPGGSWRPFHPLDRVEIWIDGATWFPHRFRVTAGDSADRDLWGERLGIPSEPAGAVLLDVRATSFAEPARLDRSVFRSSVGGAVSSGGFEPVTLNFGLIPGYTAGLNPYRSGITGSSAIASFTDGMTWLKVSALPERGAAATYASGAEVVSLDKGEAFYLPADAHNGRRVDIYGETSARVEANLPRAEVLKVAASLAVEGVVPDTVRASDGTELRRIDPSNAFEEALIPGSLPRGYELVAAIESRGRRQERTLSLYYRKPQTSFEGMGIRVVQSPGYANLPPSSEEFLNVRVDGLLARWSFERSELEWIDGSVYRAVGVPGNDLATALLVAESLR